MKFLGGSFLGILCRNSLFELVFSLLAVGQASVFPAFNCWTVRLLYSCSLNAVQDSDHYAFRTSKILFRTKLFG